ncbi:MAG: 3-deoxy-manno-octulosonate cytidylyltransferase [Saprospiraceae bacterium]|nr:3-deoxy-manno-octulosonate cytidylyltransferase [Saprospiraceae bacterium]
MKTLGIIPSRYASTRFPAKPLADIAGKSMLQRVWEQCALSKELDALFVATDDQRIFDHVLSFGGKVLMTSEAHQSGSDRCGEVLDQLEQKGHSFDIIVNIQGDEPMLNPTQIDDLIRFLGDRPKADLASQFKRTNDLSFGEDPNCVKVVTALNSKALYFSRSAVPYFRNETNAGIKKHIGLYAYKTEALKRICKLSPSLLEKTESLEQLRWLENDLSIFMQETEFENKGVDTPEDLKALVKLLNDRSIEGEG